MGELSRRSDPGRLFTLVEENSGLQLSVSWYPIVRAVDVEVGVPYPGAAEEPSYTISLSRAGSVALRDWLVEAMRDG